MKETLNLNVLSKIQPSPEAPTALLIHGLGASSKHWSKIAKDLYDEGFTVYCPDLPGHGASPRNELYSPEDWAEAIINLNIKPDLIIGHSLGGLLAATIQPKLKAPTLVLIDPVFVIPGSKKLLPIIRFSFAQSVKNSHWLARNKTVTQKIKSVLSKRPISNMSLWDPKTVQALIPNPRIIAKQLTNKDHTVVIFRPKGSLIFPQRIIKRTTAENIFYHNLKRGHNSHFFHHDNFWILMKDYLKGANNANNSIPAASTV